MKILLFCAKGFETMEFSVFIDILGWARNDFGYDVSTDTCGFSRSVVSTFGVPIIVDKLIEEVIVEEYDALAIPGGFEEFGFYEEAYDERLLQLIRDFDAQKKDHCNSMCRCPSSGKERDSERQKSHYISFKKQVQTKTIRRIWCTNYRQTYCD